MGSAPNMLRSIFCLLLLLLLPAFQAKAQVLYGSLTGNVTDPNRAAVPDAEVQLTNAQTGASVTARTGPNGLFHFDNIQSGIYEVSCALQGFRSFRRTNIEVPANEVVRVDIGLQLGETSQSIVVTDESPLLQTDRSDVHRDLSKKELTDLPVAGFRNYQSLLGLVPGVTPPADSNSIAGNPAGSLVSNVNGTSQSNNNTRIDGASNTYLWLPQLTAYVPPIESIGTVNVVTNSYDAEQGFAGGAVVSVETKSGTNEFHGSAFEYQTNSHFRARNFFDTTTGSLPKNIINQYGGTAGGPILHNRLFFFGSYEGMKQRQSFSRNTTVPTEANRQGDFSANGVALYDPATGNANGVGRQQFANGIVPASRISPISSQILALVPAPNRAGTTNNYFISAPLRLDRTNYDGKVNWNVNDKLTLFGRYARFDYSTYDEPALGAAGGTGSASGFPGEDGGTVHSVTAGGTYIITPSLLLDGHFGFTQQGQNGHDTFYGQNIGLDVLKIPGTNGPTVRESGFPGFQISGYEGMGGYVPSSPRFRTDRQYQYALNVSYTHGAHNLRWGAEMYRQEMNHYQPAGTYGPRGGFQFSGGVTALNGGVTNQFNSLAGFLLGLPSALGKSIPTTDEMRTRQWNYGFYVRDRWEVSRSLTLNLGLRYEYYPMVKRDVGGVGRYDWTTNQVLLGGYGDTPVDTGEHVNTRQFAPRLGIAWRATNRTVIRAGYGISIDPFPLAIPLRSSYPTVVEQNRAAPNTYSAAGRLADGIPPAPEIDLSSGVVTLPSTVTTNTIEGNFNRGYVQSFNFTVQRELGAGFAAEAGYVGSRSIRLTNLVDINASYPGGAAAGRPYFAAYGRTVATTLYDPAFTSNYNALQAQLTRRFAKGLSMNAAYTWSKAIGFGANNDSGLFFNTPSAIARNRSPLAFDRTHNFRLSGIYELPFGKTKPYLSHGFVALIAGGWQVNSILSLYTGTPFTVTASATSLNAPGNSQVADQVKSQVATPEGVGLGASWFDPTAFASVTAARFGNAGLNILRGPGVANLDLGLFRTFHLAERWNLQFRAEAFNATNTPHFNNPAANVSNMTLNSDGSIRSLGGFSQVTGAANDSRQVRFALRLFF
jgi:outer membrane receptor protein involved in Fe transport